MWIFPWLPLLYHGNYFGIMSELSPVQPGPPKGLAMHLLQRLTASFSAPPAPPRIYLDPEAAARAQAQRAYRLHVVQIPRLRLLGLSLVALFVLLHNLFVLPTLAAWAHLWRVLVLFALYAGVSWL